MKAKVFELSLQAYALGKEHGLGEGRILQKDKLKTANQKILGLQAKLEAALQNFESQEAKLRKEVNDVNLSQHIAAATEVKIASVEQKLVTPAVMSSTEVDSYVHRYNLSFTQANYVEDFAKEAANMFKWMSERNLGLWGGYRKQTAQYKERTGIFKWTLNKQKKNELMLQKVSHLGIMHVILV